jgi:polyribonucleotide nucleotidyltransferase
MFNEVSVFNEDLKIKFSTGKFARQAGGAVVVEAGDTAVFGAVCTGPDNPGLDFFPLTVDYREKMYAAGKIPGGFFKREARPSLKETLTCRMIDRPIRPLFPKKYRRETQISLVTWQYDKVNSPEILAINAASAALCISEADFMGPIAGVRMGYVDGKLIANPTLEQRKESKLDLIVAGTAKAITMVESQVEVLSEELLLEALEMAHKYIKSLCATISELKEKAGKEKIGFVAPEPDQEIVRELESLFHADFKKSLDLPTKQEREKAAAELKEKVYEVFAERIAEKPELKEMVYQALHDIEYDVIRDMLTVDKKRIDGRTMEQIRPIVCEIDVFSRLHGSALFTRGETQAMVALSLGGGDDEQFIDGLDDTYKERFMLHYNFPHYSVGETGRIGPTGRREIGHGELASKALRPVLPSVAEFPYTIRIVSEITESNGSSSMATVCGGALALMAGGVPIKAPVAGVAMGLALKGDKFAVLTDIQGAEDHYGDMDFKVAGTREGVTALQMDIKIEGITIEIMKQAFAQAKKARMEILDKMTAVIPEPRKEISPTAPRILLFEVPKDKIGEIIGPGGKMIRELTERFGVKIEISESDVKPVGIVKILSADGPAGEGAMAHIQSMVEEPVLGKIYQAKVVKITDFGAFCQFMPGRDGLLHISEISKTTRLKTVTEVLNEGDFVSVKLIREDKRTGKYSLSAKDVEENNF